MVYQEVFHSERTHSAFGDVFPGSQMESSRSSHGWGKSHCYLAACSIMNKHFILLRQFRPGKIREIVAKKLQSKLPAPPSRQPGHACLAAGRVGWQPPVTSQRCNPNCIKPVLLSYSHVGFPTERFPCKPISFHGRKRGRTCGYHK